MEPVRLIHLSQRGGYILHEGPPLPPGKKFKAAVNEEGEFEAPADLAERLLSVLAPQVKLATGQALPRELDTDESEVLTGLAPPAKRNKIAPKESEN